MDSGQRAFHADAEDRSVGEHDSVHQSEDVPANGRRGG